MANVSSSNGLEKYPRLRFKGFSDPWKVGTAEELFDNVVDKNHPEETVLTIIQGQGTLPREAAGRNIHYDTESLSGYKRVMKNDYVIHLRSFEGGLEIANSQGIVSPAYTILRSKKPCAPLFFDSYFHTDEFINHVLYKAVEGIRDGRQISYEAFKWLSIPYCSLEEQSQIAAFLEKINLRIEKQRSLVEHLKKYKRGLLSTLLGKEEWQTVLMKDVACGFDYGMNSAATEYDGKHKYIRITDIDESSHKYISAECVSPSDIPEAKYKVEENDILFARTGASVGKSYIYDSRDGDLYYAGFLIKASVKQNFNSYFVYLNTLTRDYQRWVILESTRSGQPGINAEQYRNYRFQCPSIEIQNRIAEIFISFDSKLQQEQEILDCLMNYRQGMLQKIFA